MSQVGVLFGNEKSTASMVSELSSIEFDANLSESHSWTSDVTTNPVETGSVVADHILILPDKITLIGFITNSPMSLSIDDDNEDKVASAIESLKELMEKKVIVDVFTKYVVYTDMAITSISIPRNSSNGNSIEVTIDFIKMNLIETQTVKVPDGISKKLDKKSGDDVKKKTEPKKDAGAKQVDGGNDASIAKNLNLSKIKDVVSGISKQILGH